VVARLGLTARQARAVAKGQKAIVSGHSPQEGGYGGQVVSAALLEDVRTAAPDEHLEVADDLLVALVSFKRLETRKADVLRQRFGLGGEEPATLTEIGKRLGLTRERIRQIEQSALAELRNRS